MFGQPFCVVLAFAYIPFPSCTAQSGQASYGTNIGDSSFVSEPYPFHDVLLNHGNALNQDTWTLTVPSSGLYLTILTAGHTGSALTDFRLVKDGVQMATMYRSSSSSSNTDTMGLDTVRYFTANEDVYVGSNSPSLFSTGDGLHTSWGTVSLSEEIAPDYGFGVARTSSSAGYISFNVVLANEGNAWDTTNNRFVAPLTGVYFFSFSTGVLSATTVSVRLRVNGNNMYYLYRTSSSSVSTNTMARSVIINLFSGDRVELYSTYTAFSDTRLLTSFSGFMFNSGRSRYMVWSTYRTSNYCTSSSTLDPFPYSTVNVNEGGHLSGNKVMCPWTGFYFVHVSAGVAGYAIQLNVMVGTEIQGELKRGGPYITDTVGRSLIVHCLAFEEIRVVKPAGISPCFYSSSSQRETTFSGFYLFA